MRTMHLAGDSTLCFYGKDRWPRAGWGMMLGHFLSDDVEVRNLALSGRSTKSFMDEGQWETLISGVRAKDGVIIQFGHNDEKSEDPSRYTKAESSFRDNLRHMVNEVQDRGAQAFLVSPVERRNFDGARLLPSHGLYPAAIEAVALECKVPYLDLCQASTKAFEDLGPQGSTRFFMHLEGGLYQGYPKDEVDNTHFNLAGAALIASLVARLMLQYPEARDFLPF